MLWYLHLAANAGIVVVAYSDAPVGTMEENPDGSGQFAEVVLRPSVTVTDPATLRTRRGNARRGREDVLRGVFGELSGAPRARHRGTRRSS